MRIARVLVLLGCLLAHEAFAGCGAMPWTFGMTKEQVVAITECGPYKSFKNGDLETYKGVFNGKEENFQFFFDDEKLRRIGVYLYEGPDPDAGAERWLALHATMSGMFGAIETPSIELPDDAATRRNLFKTRALDLLNARGKVQMAPLTQPKNAFVFSSFARHDLASGVQYVVVLYFDQLP